MSKCILQTWTMLYTERNILQPYFHISAFTASWTKGQKILGMEVTSL